MRSACRRECRLGIHDLSRIQLSRTLKLPRFNMPLELGTFLGATHFGDPRQRQKRCPVLDQESYRYQVSTSDIAGQDIRAHHDSPDTATRAVRDRLSQFVASGTTLPGGQKIVTHYTAFCRELPAILRTLSIKRRELIYNDYTTVVTDWLGENT